MKITEVRIFPTQSKDGRLEAYATMTFDDWFVVRNVKIIKGNTGLFVAMPSRKAMETCRKCGFKNARGSKYCNDCGTAIRQQAPPRDSRDDKKQSDHMDIAHPIRQACRIYIQEQILEAFNDEMKRKDAEGDAYKPAGTKDLDSGVIDDAQTAPERVSEEQKEPEEKPLREQPVEEKPSAEQPVEEGLKVEEKKESDIAEETSEDNGFNGNESIRKIVEDDQDIAL